MKLRYRGVRYSNQPVSSPAEKSQTTSVAERTRWLAISREKANRNRQASMLRRTSDEIGLA